jgi:ABC-type transporter Mla MlaB component
MLKISMIDSRTQRRLVLEGALTPPWIAELKSSWEEARAGAQGRHLVLDLKNVTHINANGEEALSELMNQGARFTSGGVFIKHILRELTRRKAGGKKPGRAATQGVAVLPIPKETK